MFNDYTITNCTSAFSFQSADYKCKYLWVKSSGKWYFHWLFTSVVDPNSFFSDSDSDSDPQIIFFGFGFGYGFGFLD
jgi:hypothetical protein